MKFGFHGINLGPLATPEAVRQIVTTAEKHDIDSIWAGDHVINATRISSQYPYSPTGTFPLEPSELVLEPLMFMAFLAGQTSKIQIGISVLIVPYRNPVVTAKAISTLDFLSHGRVIVGMGSGWMKEEFDALGVPYAERGKQTDEYIHIFKELWTKEAPSFQGTYHQFSNITCYPQPVQKPYPPIWIGGNSKRAMRRALELGDGWQPGWSRPDQLAHELEEFKRVAERIGRDPQKVELSLLRPIQILDKSAQTRRALIGTPEEVAEDIRQYQKLGVTHLLFAFKTRRLEEVIEIMERFATQVRPLLA